jgi:signal transduction histidine kinase
VIINLIRNALEAMQETPDPWLSVIALKKKSEQVQISVTDNGAGIPDEVVGKIFLPFYSTKTNNSGIGLSLAQQIMLLHNGRIEVSSGENRGTTFTMLF